MIVCVTLFYVTSFLKPNIALDDDEHTINIVDAREFKNARLAKVVENIFKPRTDWPGDSPRIRRGVQNNMLQPTRAFTT